VLSVEKEKRPTPILPAKGFKPFTTTTFLGLNRAKATKKYAVCEMKCICGVHFMLTYHDLFRNKSCGCLKYTKRVRVDNRKRGFREVEREKGLTRNLVKGRVYRGWDHDKAVSTPSRQPRMLTMNGTTQTLNKWAKQIGLSYSALLDRIEHGWPVEEALTTPRQFARRGKGGFKSTREPLRK
jgi:hypothetical protein